ncbi:RNA polymerase sigma factor [Actinomadura violacea]|uniref:RNA polymerase sigma factor n=1 Tax=Actinomadura violacea TaxID=2819934 RepID=A0ABS3S2L4_9ACTN|nr:RNA polymerase sigma factor [Actinomadura violacea]MBO2462978.1 RNA polymerase sigma factor [Actinomadura violacea]
MADDAAERFTVLFRRHHARVRAYVLRRTDEERADDVVAEAFTAVWRHIDRLPDDPLPWLYRAAHNCLNNDRRSRARRARLAGRLAQHHRDAPDHAAGVVEEVRLREALWRLPDADREALMLVAWEDLDHRSAAYVAGCSAAAFKVRVHRARKRLAALLTDDISPAEEAAR